MRAGLQGSDASRYRASRMTPGQFSDLLDGAVAQLGERLLCKQEVVGSIPSGSTTLRAMRFGWRAESQPLFKFALRAAL